MMRVGVVIFPGSNCDVDALRAFGEIDGCEVEAVWHDQRDLSMFDAIVLPGGFSWGDYLRCGAIAATAPVMHGVREAAERGTLVIGICNGFQILVESGLLPGVLLRNDHLQFRCDVVELEVCNDTSPFTHAYTRGDIIRIPIAHGEGSYFADEHTLRQLEQQGRVAFRYSSTNPNGSIDAIAGVLNERGNVLGMMPHPERAIRDWMGSTDGIALFESMLASWKETASVLTHA